MDGQWKGRQTTEETRMVLSKKARLGSILGVEETEKPTTKRRRMRKGRRERDETRKKKKMEDFTNRTKAQGGR